MTLRFSAFLFAAIFALTAHAQVVHVSPRGNDKAQGTQSAPVRSLERALVLARQTHEHTVELAGGVYRLSAPLALTSSDSGLTLKATTHESVTLSGGTRVTGWKLADARRSVWSAHVPEEIAPPRQIYVDGVRASRAQGRSPVKLTMTETGYTADSDLLSHWLHPDDLEFVYTGGNALWGEHSVGLGSWTEPRCPVSTVHGTEIEMAEPCWQNSTKRAMLPNGTRSANLVGPTSMGKEPTYIDNAYELLGTPGEFYFDHVTHTLFYTPRKGEDLHSADVEVPVLESLLELNGSVEEPVQHVAISGITFAYAAWREPSTSEGFSEIQANYRVTTYNGATKQALCTLVPGGACPFASWAPEPGNVSATFADDVHFTRDIFTHLGAAGLSLTGGAHRDVIEGCVFTDISGNGLELAGVDKPMAPDVEFAIKNRIEDNLFRNVGAEFHGGIPIVVGYARFTHIAHNQIDHVPYAGISIGWGGWPDKIALPGVTNRSTGNVIERNRITHYMLKLSDGGGIYTQGRTGITIADGEHVESNVIDDQFSTGHAIYTDNGSAMITIRGNVMFNTNHDNWGSRHKDYYDGGKGDSNDPLAIEGNWWEQGDPDTVDKQVIEKDNHTITALTQAPAELLEDAGLEAGFRDLITAATPKTAPEAPTAVSAFETFTEAYITWRPPVFEGGAPVDHYTVRSNDGLQITLSAEKFNKLAYAQMPIKRTSKSRIFTVTASNAHGSSVKSLPSNPVTASTAPFSSPGVPQTVKAYVDGSRASIHFGAPKENTEGIIAYAVTVRPGGRRQVFTGRRMMTLEGRHITFVTMDGLTPDTKYTFGVSAVNPLGEGEPAWSKNPEESSQP